MDMERLEAIEEELGCDPIEFLEEAMYVLKHSSQVEGTTRSGTSIGCDFGYVEDFIKDIRKEINRK